MAEFHPVEWAKAHPYATGFVVFGVGALALLIFYDAFAGSGGSNTSASQYAAYEQAAAAAAESGNQLQALQGELQAADNQIQAQSTVANNQTAAAVQVAQIQSDTATNEAQLAEASAEATAKYNAQATETTSTVGAQAVVANSNNNLEANLFDTLAGLFTSQSNALAAVGSPVAIGTGFLQPTTGGGFAFGVSTIPNRVLENESGANLSHYVDALASGPVAGVNLPLTPGPSATVTPVTDIHA